MYRLYRTPYLRLHKTLSKFTGDSVAKAAQDAVPKAAQKPQLARRESYCLHFFGQSLHPTLRRAFFFFLTPKFR